MADLNNTLYIGGSKEIVLRRAAKILEVEGEKLLNHPDFLLIESPTVIGDIEPIVERAFLNPIIAKRRVFVIENLGSLNTNGQDRLLKVLEDCEVTILATENGGYILPTIYSRMSKVYPTIKNDASTIEGAASGDLNVTFAPEIIAVYKKVVDAIDTDFDILKALSLVNMKANPSVKDEKDVLGLFTLIANVLYAYYAKFNGAKVKTPSNLSKDYSERMLQESLARVGEVIKRLKNNDFPYTKNDLYRDVYFVQKGGKNYGR